ncbi:hypothetical protein [Halobacillus sp. Marseille-Q1614]|uniref:hypothetical protein n=1 Tax=Halobacillus sp. Marseille-Q1614 TaxID=2709134 RepID=UPI00156D4F84|nr:hypothetical protein [Halobacillus sp. Marseille-Q1614]
MKKVSKRFLFISIGAIVLFMLGMSWFFPYSPFSIYKSYIYKPDPVVAEGYAQDLNTFKNTYNPSTTDDNRTNNMNQYIVPLFEQDWLIHKDKAKMGNPQIESFLIEVKEARQNLLSLLVEEDYTREEREYLMITVEGLLGLEESIVDLKFSHSESRSTINRQFRNLHVSYINTFGRYATFYEVFQNKGRASE